MKEGNYSTVLYYTKISPPSVEGIIPKIGKKKLLERLARYGRREEEIDSTWDGASYSVVLQNDYLLVIRPTRQHQTFF